MFVVGFLKEEIFKKEKNRSSQREGTYGFMVSWCVCVCVCVCRRGERKGPSSKDGEEEVASVF